eukprot:UN09774
MENWTKHVGYPLVKASLNDKKQLVLKQTRFLASGPATAEQDKVVWQIPIVALQGKKETRFLFKEREMVCTELGQITSWIHLNHELTGIYRVQYD